MKGSLTGRNTKAGRIVSAILLVLTGLYIALGPHLFKDKIDEDHYRAFYLPDYGQSAVIIRVWHVVSIRSFSGSVTSWIKSCANEFSKKYPNVYFEVKGMTPEEAKLEFSRGVFPDVISFSNGTISQDSLKEITVNGGVYHAVPYFAGGYLLVYRPEALFETDIDELTKTAGSVQEFRNGNASSCICDIGSAGDLARALYAGKCDHFDISPIFDSSPPVQFLGIMKKADDKKLTAAKDFIEALTDNKAQSEITKLGLIPVNRGAETFFEFDWMKELYESYDPD